jgi:glycosyltransferase involved in cell wall biosynthesis
MNQQRYVIVTPARNEQDNIVHTIRSMAGQTRLPALWIIVNDGSIDRTREMIDAAAREYSWIQTVHRADRGFRKQGGGVVEAFYDGYDRIVPGSWDYLVKFDADLSFQPDYFERCLNRFAEDSKLGIGGGMICQEIDGVLACESADDPAFHVRGATKIYRQACWEAIGGLMRAPGWDTVDELKANMLGWKTMTFQNIQLMHHRPTGAASGSWNDWVKNGVANYITGYDPVFMACKCLRRTIRRPYLNGLGLWVGFMKGYLKRIPQVNDRAVISYLRRQQWRALTLRNSFWR